MVGREALWRLVIDVKFESLNGGWCSKEVLGTFGVAVWKHIRREWDKFCNFVRFEVGVESRVCFWHDWWCGDRSLKQCFPVLFSIVRNKDAMVVLLYTFCLLGLRLSKERKIGL
jgi:hypothetical protein